MQCNYATQIIPSFSVKFTAFFFFYQSLKNNRGLLKKKKRGPNLEGQLVQLEEKLISK